MGLFFLLAGYFTPGAVERHGAPAYARERMLRLGLPLISRIFCCFAPVTIASRRDGARAQFSVKAFVYVWTHGLMEPGPLWFCQALLIFARPAISRCTPSRRAAGGSSRPSFPSNATLARPRSAQAPQRFCCASSGRRERRSSICSLAISRAMSCCSRLDASPRLGQASTRRRRSSGGYGSRSPA